MLSLSYAAVELLCHRTERVSVPRDFHNGQPGGSSLHLTFDVAAPPDQDVRPGECLVQCRWFLVFWEEVLFL